MAVPRFQSLMLPVLTALDDGVVHQPQLVCDVVAAQLGVSAEDQAGTPAQRHDESLPQPHPLGASLHEARRRH